MTPAELSTVFGERAVLTDSLPEVDEDIEQPIVGEGRVVSGSTVSGDRHDAVLGDASEPWLRDYEVVCEVTGYVFNKVLDRSPHIDLQGRPI